MQYNSSSSLLSFKKRNDGGSAERNDEADSGETRKSD